MAMCLVVAVDAGSGWWEQRVWFLAQADGRSMEQAGVCVRLCPYLWGAAWPEWGWEWQPRPCSGSCAELQSSS